MAKSRRLAAILVADVVGYSRLMGKNEVGTLDGLGAHRRELIEPKIAEHEGRIVKLLGDGLLAEFPSAVEAVAFAVEAQTSMRERNADVPEDSRIVFRIGINIGDVIVEGDDIYGDGVNVAARLEGLCVPGGVALSGNVHEQVKAKLDLRFEDSGEHEFKNIDGAIRVWRWIAETPSVTVTDAVSASKPVPWLAGRPAIAVLSFRVLSEDPEVRLIGAGLTEDLAVLLARVPGFSVVSRDCARIVDTEDLAAQEAGALLWARYLVTGTIQGRGKRLRISVRLTDTQSDQLLWTKSFEQTGYEDPLDFQSEMAREIAQCIDPELARAEFSRVERRPFESLDAWELYHRAQGLLVLKGLSRDIVRQAFELLRRSVEIDPDFAIAHAQMAAIYAWCNTLSIDLGESDLPTKTIASLDRALELDRRNPTVLGFIGCALCDLRQHRRGLDLLAQAVELDPSNAIAQAALGAGHLAMREIEEGIERLREGIRLSPLDERAAFWRTLLARALYRLGRFNEAADEARQACRRSDSMVASRVVLAVIELARGDVDAAAEAMSEARRIEPGLKTEEMRAVAGSQGMDLLREAGLTT